MRKRVHVSNRIKERLKEDHMGLTRREEQAVTVNYRRLLPRSNKKRGKRCKAEARPLLGFHHS